MPRGLNKVMLIGNLGKDPEMKYTPSGMPVTTFSVAVSRSWRTASTAGAAPVAASGEKARALIGGAVIPASA